MKRKSLIAGLILCVGCMFQSCSTSGEDEINGPSGEANFRIDYTLTSGNMKSIASEVYEKFYEDHIKTRKLTPDTYSIVFTHKGTGQKIEVKGLWSENKMVRMPEGTYTVTGTSADGTNTYVCDKAVLSFSEEITVTADMESLIVKAQYASPLLFFSAESTKSVTYYAISYPSVEYQAETLPKVDGYHYAFMKAFGGVSLDYKSHFEIEKNSGTSTKMYTNSVKLDNGKYYFYDDVTGGFSLDPMTPGS